MRSNSDYLRGQVMAAMEGGLSYRTAADRFGVAPSAAGAGTGCIGRERAAICGWPLRCKGKMK